MPETVLHHRGTYLVRRLVLPPGDATPWHRDPFHRVTVVLSGDLLEIQFEGSAELKRVPITPGEACWEEPTARVHRGVNVGQKNYEEITTFFLDSPDAVPQPQAKGK